MMSFHKGNPPIVAEAKFEDCLYYTGKLLLFDFFQDIFEKACYSKTNWIKKPMSKLEERLNKLVETFSTADKKAWSLGSGSKSKQSDQGGITSQVVNLVIEQAILERASDIHIEPVDQKTRIRYRVDGELYETLNLDDSSHFNIIPRIKIVAGLDTDAMAKRKSQDGRFTLQFGASNFDFRVATFPTVEGEKLVIRILDKTANIQRLEAIGLDKNDQARIERFLQLKNGLILVCGPTGSGKTTTLYAMLQRLNKPENNIVTLEDPVEYKVKGMNQCDISGKLDMNFADGLRAILRQDPNVILVGEIRDKETAEIATRAAITGHLVLSSVHANSAIGTVIRLINMELDHALVSYSMIGAVAQRLVRRLCDQCRTARVVTPQQMQRLRDVHGVNLDLFQSGNSLGTDNNTIAYLDYNKNAPQKPPAENNLTFWEGQGCVHCNGTGYKGRTAIFEVVAFNQELRDAILARAPSSELEKIAVRNGAKLLAMDGLEKAKMGLTTLDEIYPLLIDN